MSNLKLISATDTQYSDAVLKVMNEQRNLGLFCDVTIIIKDRKFKAHKIVLSASSTYFYQLFSAAGQVIELNFIRPQIFEQILNYVYSSKITRVRSDMMEELISAGEILGVKFIANLGGPLSKVKGLPGLSKETDDTENKSDEATGIMPIITESFSISAEEFNQTHKSADEDDDSDDDVMFVSHMDAETRAANRKPSEIIDLDPADSENVTLNPKVDSNNVAKKDEKTSAPVIADPVKPPSISSQNPVVANSSSSTSRVSMGSAPTTPARIINTTLKPLSTPPSAESSNIIGVHKKQVATLTQTSNSKIRLLDLCKSSPPPSNIPKPAVTSKKTVTLNTTTEIDSISSGCKVYANIGENTYDIVPVKDDPGEGGSKVNKGKRPLIETPLKPGDKIQMPQKTTPCNKKSKAELEDHHELIMDGKTFYVCIVCKRPYVCLASLRRHFNTHSWEKKYPCRYCDKVFALAEYRTKHEIQHTGERRYQCLLCPEAFFNYQVLSNHCKLVHNEDPSGKKKKDNNLYRLLPCKTLPIKASPWTTDVPVISEDGSHEVRSMAQTSRMLNWDEIFAEPDDPPNHRSLSATNVNATPQGAEFDFSIPETY